MTPSSTPFIILLCTLVGCAPTHPPVINVPTEIGPYGCRLPTQDVVLNKYEVEIAGNSVGDFALGRIDYKSHPELRNIMSQASKDGLLDEYLICLAINRGDVTTQEQKNHLRSKLHFMRGTPAPSPSEIDNWDKSHPFPVSMETYFRLRTERAEKERDEARDNALHQQKIIAGLLEQLKASEDARRESFKNSRFSR